MHHQQQSSPHASVDMEMSPQSLYISHDDNTNNNANSSCQQKRQPGSATAMIDLATVVPGVFSTGAFKQQWAIRPIGVTLRALPLLFAAIGLIPLVAGFRCIAGGGSSCVVFLALGGLLIAAGILTAVFVPGLRAISTIIDGTSQTMTVTSYPSVFACVARTTVIRFLDIREVKVTDTMILGGTVVCLVVTPSNINFMSDFAPTGFFSFCYGSHFGGKWGAHKLAPTFSAVFGPHVTTQGYEATPMPIRF